ncbi:MAG: hypothetical protein ACD_20C00002G0002 [uncultured bacterium]|nr:MAG: hypothetical protein ACD_20C00002G0002 [uncultured bacterium]HBH19104.1 hypothetical protein [Cyanobacteria bacterium UBA9579]
MEWFRNLKIAQKIIGLVLVILVFICLLGFISFNLLNASNKQFNKMYDFNLQNVIKVQNMKASRILDEKLLLGFILAKDSNDWNRVAKAMDIADNYTEEIFLELEKINFDKEDKEILDQLNIINDKWSDIGDTITELAKSGKKEDAYKFYLANIETHNVLMKKTDEFVNAINDDAANAKKEQDLQAIATKIELIVIILISIGLTLVLGLFIARIIARPLEEMIKCIEKDENGNIQIKEVQVNSKDEVGQLGMALNALTAQVRKFVEQVARTVEEMSAGSEEMSAATEQTAQGAQQVATSITQLATGSQEQASSVTGCLENINKISKAIQLISENSGETVNISKNTETNAGAGRMQAAKAVEKINQIKLTSVDTSKTIKDLGKLSSDIEVIVDLIKNIAGQTNLLALNAAIEAARAGEHGKGFAVVADEVKKLASQSAEATDKITGMIKEIQNKATEAVTAMDNGVNEVEDGVVTIESVGEALESILNAAKEASGNIQEISNEVNSLARNSDNVVKMMEDISSITEESSASAEEISSITEEQTASLEEISASSQSLAKIAENLQKQVAIFKV